MNIISVIPARGGSKRLPGKNALNLCGKPLLVWTIEASLRAKRISRTVVSTDDEGIARIAVDSGAEAPFIRPVLLAGDTTPTVDVIRHALGEIGSNGVDLVAVLQPTSPLRTFSHIEHAIDIFLSVEKADSLVSCVRLPHQFTQEKLMETDEKGFVIQSIQGGRSSASVRTFARNGPAIVLTTPQNIEAGSLYGHATVAFEMESLHSVDIDTQMDFEFASFLMGKQLVDGMGSRREGSSTPRETPPPSI